MPIRSSMLLELALVCVVACLSGCAHGSLERVSAGFMACPETEVVVSDDSGDRGGLRTWFAACRGERYRCRAVWSGEHAETVAVSCAPATPRQARESRPAPLRPAGQ